MTNEEALALKKGDKITFNGKKYKVLCVRKDRKTIAGKPLITIKATGHNETWFCLDPSDIELGDKENDS